MLKRFLLGILAVAVIAAVGFGVYTYKPAMDPVARDDQPAFDADLVEQGRILAAAGYCATCHTASDGAPYAGNYPMETQFGTIYSTNLTPDVDTGIGTYSQAAFRRAMHEGVDREGNHLFPAFPYDHFTKMSDADVDAIYAYIMTEVAPVQTVQKENELPFPLNLRMLQSGWKLLFADFGRYEADEAHSDEWNRGAYLAEGVTHCGACHTPRNALGAEREDAQFAGAEIDRWIAPALTAGNPSHVPWSAAEFKSYLESGVATYHGVAAGPMGPVVHAGVRALPEADIAALSIYLADKVGAQDDDPAGSAAVMASLKANRPDPQYRGDLGARLYATACASCHYNAEQIAQGRPDLGINSATNLDDPTNLIHVMLDGVNGPVGIAGVVMPGFRQALNDEEITAIAAYLRDKRAEKPAWANLATTVSEIRAQGRAAH
ncbi:cytochrome c [Pseudooceanicola sediminis]|uniref:Cytochrome c n=2 Tax=Pseudooceanicola sediminis TaxID=2211117 RepID=A0A399JA57_9RHOB|nr:c-type cytochrome [Puniceibacterium sp. HSS470]RII39536.1 cytochrome c [Pseudooceanicola sediminis]